MAALRSWRRQRRGLSRGRGLPTKTRETAKNLDKPRQTGEPMDRLGTYTRTLPFVVQVPGGYAYPCVLIGEDRDGPFALVGVRGVQETLWTVGDLPRATAEAMKAWSDERWRGIIPN